MTPKTETSFSVGLSAAKSRLLELREAGIAVHVLDPIEKARRNPKSLRLAITAKCWDCVGAGADPRPRANIRDCGVKACSLYPVRPFQGGKEPNSWADHREDDGA
jgi:hypothetical protein